MLVILHEIMSTLSVELRRRCLERCLRRYMLTLREWRIFRRPLNAYGSRDQEPAETNRGPLQNGISGKIPGQAEVGGRVNRGD
jgi:hypothetical protein